MTTTNASDLDKMIPTPVVVHVGGKEVIIQVIKVRQLPSVMKTIRPFIGSMSKGQELNVPALLMDHSDSILPLVSILTGETEDWVGDLNMEELVVLFSSLVEVNLDFFTLRVLPTLAAAMGRMSGGPKTPTQSPGLILSST